MSDAREQATQQNLAGGIVERGLDLDPGTVDSIRGALEAKGYDADQVANSIRDLANTISPPAENGK